MPPALTEVGLQKGEVLFYQGEPSGDFFVLREGGLEILISEDLKAKGPALIDSSRRMAVIDTVGAPIGEIGAILDERRTATVRAVGASRLLRIPAHGKAFREWLHENPRVARIIAKALAERLRRNEARDADLRAFEAQANRLLEGFSLVYALLVPVAGIDPKAEIVRKEILARGQATSKLLERDGEKPVRPSLALIERTFREKTQTELGGTTFDSGLVSFLADAVEEESISEFWESQPQRLLFAIERMAASFPALNAKLRGTGRGAERVVTSLVEGPASILAAYRDLLESRDPVRREALPYAQRLAESVEALRTEMLDLLGRFPPEGTKGLDSLRQRLAREEAPPAATSAPLAPEPVTAAVSSPSAPPASPDVPLRKVKVMESILKMDLSEGVKERFPAALAKAEEGDLDAARLATKLYWEIYPTVFKNFLTERRAEWVWFLRYGFAFDGEAAPDLLEKFPTDPGKPGPILYVDDWLMKVYRGEVSPSRNELGLTYAESVQDRAGKRWNETETDPAMDLVRYEIEGVLSVAARATTGGRKGSMPCFGSPAALEAAWVNPSQVAQEILKVIGIDFSAFYREVRVQLSGTSEFLPKEVVPRFFLIPSMGGRGVPWQEFEGKAKDTPGRIFIPLRPEGDFAGLLVETIGRFRWVLARAVAGYSWADPVEGGLTGRYLDYITFYKKNPELTEEMKAKIADDFKSLSLDVDKFVRDYSLWMRYESQGIQRLNRVARRIFCEFTPFAISLRKNVSKNPAFTEILIKDSNKRRKSRIEMERKMQKYQQDGVDPGDAFKWAFTLFEFTS